LDEVLICFVASSRETITFLVKMKLKRCWLKKCNKKNYKHEWGLNNLLPIWFEELSAIFSGKNNQELYVLQSASQHHV